MTKLSSKGRGATTMAYSRLGLDFVDMSKADLPTPPYVHIYAKVVTTDKRGMAFVTPACTSLDQLEEQIDRLHRDLEGIRAKAHRKFEAMRRRRGHGAGF
jgi:hypothetical protein